MLFNASQRGRSVFWDEFGCWRTKSRFLKCVKYVCWAVMSKKKRRRIIIKENQLNSENIVQYVIKCNRSHVFTPATGLFKVCACVCVCACHY